MEERGFAEEQSLEFRMKYWREDASGDSEDVEDGDQ